MRERNTPTNIETTQHVHEVHRKLLAARKLGAEALKGMSREDSGDFITSAAEKVSENFTNKGMERHKDYPIIELTRVMSATINALPDLRDGSKEVKAQAKEQVIDYNGSLKSIIRNHTGIAPQQLVHTVRSVAMNLGHSKEQADDIVYETEMAARGMKHELAAESVFLNLPDGYDYREGTTEEDKKGIDYIVTAPNGAEVRIDVKASQTAADNAWNKQVDYYASKGQDVPQDLIIMESGYENEDFIPGSWNARYEATQEITPFWKSAIDQAAGYIDDNSSTSHDAHESVLA